MPDTSSEGRASTLQMEVMVVRVIEKWVAVDNFALSEPRSSLDEEIVGEGIVIARTIYLIGAIFGEACPTDVIIDLDVGGCIESDA